MEFVSAIILGIVEGLTEFLPISSTGHLILVEQFVSLTADSDFNECFMVLIQLPAIGAVCAYFFKDLWPLGVNPETRRARLSIWAKAVVGFLPAVVVGLLIGELTALFQPIPVALALIIGGIVLFEIEKHVPHGRITTFDDLTYRKALLIGMFQCLAMVPGVSRSAATIIGARLLGTDRRIAAEYSFFLAIPTMIGASAYTLLKTKIAFTTHQWALVAVGGIVAFLTAYLVIGRLMHFIKQHDFRVFGIYRIILGAIMLIYFLLIA